ncbi:leucine--tRNA ligase, partial [Candidatus Gottesmanbacteria bacterium]|nr:leucine--tRNA ligase [Candidatus Gottesmanbacteria bacterium]
YNLMMFPYPSAEGLHVGNMYAFTGADIYGRYKRMQGYDVFEPIGLDGFGIHSENYAIKIGKNPSEQAKISENNFYRQLRAIGNGFAWENHLETYDPDYYKWTQWIFVRMFKAGLAYRKKSPVNFCPSCKTVLSDEQVIDGACERCKSKVEKRDMEQWYFRITKYADKLLNNIEKLAWTNKVKVGQRNWIGKKEGINIKYQISNFKYQIECFTTRPDTNFGATFIVIGPEHQFVASLLSSKFKVQSSKLTEIKKYVELAKQKSETDRISEGRKKTGVFSGFYCLNGLNDYKMPIYISDFVLGHVGTGAVVGVPGHDLRDFEFAKEFDIPIIRVVVGKDGDKSQITKTGQVQEEEGTMINSEFLNGLDIHQATVKMMDHLEEKGWGKRVTTFKLRDWCISRQRYWGAPIPMIKCPKCDWVPVPEDDLPVLLPKEVKDWKPEGTGKGPLAKIDSFVKTKCPQCGGKADRETDVCDTFLDSSWYHLRYPSIKVKNPKSNPPAGGQISNEIQNPNIKDKLEIPWDP